MSHVTSGSRTLWLLIADSSRSDLHLVIPSVAWMAADAGALFECYLEAPRDGQLFAANNRPLCAAAAAARHSA